MRYKEHTVRKLEAQTTKLKTLQRSISNSDISGQQAVEFIDAIVKELLSHAAPATKRLPS